MVIIKTMPVDKVLLYRPDLNTVQKAVWLILFIITAYIRPQHEAIKATLGSDNGPTQLPNAANNNTSPMPNASLRRTIPAIQRRE